MIEFTDRVSVPEKCKNCPAMAQLAHQHDAYSENIDELTEAGLSGELREALIGLAMEDDDVSYEEAAARVARHQDIVVEETSNVLDELDLARDLQATLANKALQLCKGQLSLEGQSDGQRVIAHVCMSDMHLFMPDVPGSEVVTVERMSEEESREDYEA